MQVGAVRVGAARAVAACAVAAWPRRPRHVKARIAVRLAAPSIGIDGGGDGAMGGGRGQGRPDRGARRGGIPPPRHPAAPPLLGAFTP